MMKQNDLGDWKEGLSESDLAAIGDFFAELKKHIHLSSIETAQMLSDFENALKYYQQNGVELSEALIRLDPANLGGFFVRPSSVWYSLDDAAKIYPLSMKRSQMAVFRLAVDLKEQVIPELLQIALHFTIKRFPSFATTLKRGFFWYYLNSRKQRYAVEQENTLPCQPLNITSAGAPALRVQYYQKRISVEFFHILTDGTGGMIFLKTLTAAYLALLGMNIEVGFPGIFDINAVPAAEETANEFGSAEKTENSSGFMDKPATQMSGELAKSAPCRVLHFRIDADELHNMAKQHQATITAYVLSRMFVAARYATEGTSGSFNFEVPVNMRKFYPSETVRNFAMYCGIRIPIDQIKNADELIPEISEQLSTKANKQSMSEMMNSTKKILSAIQFVPLAVKSPIAKIVYGFLGDGIFTSTLSNIGIVKLPDAMAEQIESMDFVLGTSNMHRASCTLVTVNKTATFSISKMTADPSFEEMIANQFQKDGLSFVLEGSELYAD